MKEDGTHVITFQRKITYKPSYHKAEASALILLDFIKCTYTCMCIYFYLCVCILIDICVQDVQNTLKIVSAPIVVFLVRQNNVSISIFR